MNMDIQEFIQIFGEAIEAENIGELTPETEFHDLDEWSSLSVIIMISLFDEKFGKEVDNTAIRKAETIQDLYDLATA